jgi:tetratricopeptide (TPR) repeat protein
MRAVAQKLMTLHYRQQADNTLSGGLFGEDNLSRFIELNRLPFRIGFWPIIAADPSEAELAMGIAACLAVMIDRYPSTRVYRVFQRLDRPAADTTATQFSVDDWELDGLDENIALWGALTVANGAYTLELSIENDLIASDAPQRLTWTQPDLPALVSSLTKIASEVAAALELGQYAPYLADYTVLPADHAALPRCLAHAAAWERDLLLHLSGQAVDFRARATAVLADMPRTPFGAWLFSNLLTRAMLPGFAADAERLLPNASETLHAFESEPDAIALCVPIVALALFGLTYTHEAYKLLQEDVVNNPQHGDSWMLLCDLYASTRQSVRALDTFQEAIENGVEHIYLFLQYANLLTTMSYEGHRIETFVLIDPDKIPSERLLYEAIAAYDEVLKLHPDHAYALYQKAMLNNDLDEAQNWDDFKRLVAADKDGERLRELCNNFYELDDFNTPISILNAALEQQPARYDLALCKIVLLLRNDETAAAETEINRLKPQDLSVEARRDLERLALSVDDGDFETYFAEQSEIVNAGNEIDEDAVEYFEDCLQRAPNVPELYTLIARAYLNWEEDETALDLLNDGQKRIPYHPQIVLLLAETLWKAEEFDTALQYLKTGVDKNPRDVALLAKLAQYLVEDTEDEEARVYLVRAEAIARDHPDLLKARTAIAREIRARKDDDAN